MIGLDRLIARPGVIAALQFSEDGNLIRSAGELSKEVTEKMAMICGKISITANKAVSDFSDATHLDCEDLNGWYISGGQHAFDVYFSDGVFTGVFIECAKVDLNQLRIDLYGPPAAGKAIM
jgi:roadblock/LC7 domain-containing protein